MVVHRCNGCGIERQNRVAADDNPTALLRLAPSPTGLLLLDTRSAGTGWSLAGSPY